MVSTSVNSGSSTFGASGAARAGWSGASDARGHWRLLERFSGTQAGSGVVRGGARVE